MARTDHTLVPRSRIRAVDVHALVALAIATGCGQEVRERPPYSELSCVGDKCTPGAGGAVVGVSPSPADGVTEAETTDRLTTGQPTDGDGGLSLVIDPQEASDLQRTLGAPIGRPYSLYQWPELDAAIWQSTGLNAESVAVSGQGEWLLVRVTDGVQAPDLDWLSTLSWQLPSNEPAIIPVFRAQFWSDLAAGLALSPTTLDPSASQVLVQVVDALGNPLLGVSAEVVSGAIAYGNGGSASDVLTETDDSGTLIWINAPAGPGTTLTLRGDSDPWSVVLPTIQGGVTVAAVGYEPPP